MFFIFAILTSFIHTCGALQHMKYSKLQHTKTIRSECVVWRDHQDTVIKKVEFSKGTRFSPQLENESKILNDLPLGWVYRASKVYSNFEKKEDEKLVFDIMGSV